MWEVVRTMTSMSATIPILPTISFPQVEAETEKEELPEAIETHLFKAFKGVASQRADHCERTVFLIKKSAIEIIDGNYDAPAHKHTFVGGPRIREAGCLRAFGRCFYKVVKDWFR
jgi:hypothetical protein